MTLPSIPVKGAMPCIEKACSACCHDIEMLLTNDDLARIKARRPDEDFYFLADDGYLQLRTRSGPAARGGQGKPCHFLNPDGRCDIHDVRPEGCRLYPAMWVVEARTAELDADYCPHTDGFLLPPATADATRRLAKRLQDEQRARTPAGT
jgi:uncharacterized protein